jgi:hypothetical protein
MYTYRNIYIDTHISMVTLNTVSVTFTDKTIPPMFKPIIDSRYEQYRLNVSSDAQLAVLNSMGLFKHTIECITIEHDWYMSHITYFLNITYITESTEYDYDMNLFRYRLSHDPKIQWDTVLFNTGTSLYMVIHKHYLLINIAMLHNYSYLDAERTILMRMLRERHKIFEQADIELNIIQVRRIYRVLSWLLLPELAGIIHEYYTDILLS